MRHFHDELEGLRQELLRMALLVEDGIRLAVNAITKEDPTLVEKVYEGEEVINSLEIRIDEKGHELLGLEQPVAVDLRRLTMILKITTDLERMGDHAVNIAQRAKHFIKHKGQIVDPLLGTMAEAAQKMLKNAVDAFISEDDALARTVLAGDDTVDEYYNKISKNTLKIMQDDADISKLGVNMIMMAYNLERVADLASNIAEDVIYIKEGKEVRHHVTDD